MAAPSFVSETEVPAWNSTTNPKTSGSFSVSTGDIIVCVVIAENGSALAAATATNTGGAGMTFTQRVINPSPNSSANAGVKIWTAVADGAKSITVTVTVSAINFGYDLLVFGGSDGVGATANTNSGTGTGAPTVNLTTTQANSAVVVAVGDWAAVTGADTWRSNAGALTETSFYADGVIYGVHVGYHADAGSVGTYAIGISSPSTMRYTIGGVEIKGSAAAAAVSLVFDPPRLIRAILVR